MNATRFGVSRSSRQMQSRTARKERQIEDEADIDQLELAAPEGLSERELRQIKNLNPRDGDAHEAFLRTFNPDIYH